MAEQAQEMVVDATPKKTAFMDKRSTHEDRIKKDEEELELLKKQAQVKEPEEPVTEEKAEDKEKPKNAEERTLKSVMEIYEDTLKKKKSSSKNSLTI